MQRVEVILPLSCISNWPEFEFTLTIILKSEVLSQALLRWRQMLENDLIPFLLLAGAQSWPAMLSVRKNIQYLIIWMPACKFRE